jgi:hypothetical protein
MLQNDFSCFINPLKNHNPKTDYFIEIYLFAKIHDNNLYVNTIMFNMILLVSKDVGDLFVIDSSTFKCWFHFLNL